jgi:hypothetical protein
MVAITCRPRLKIFSGIQEKRLAIKQQSPDFQHINLKTVVATTGNCNI